MNHLPKLMPVLSDIENVGGVVGFSPTTLSEDHFREVERVLDEIFERGYQAGYADAKECV